MLVDFYAKPAAKQCDFASAMFGMTCCASPLPGGCDRGAFPENIYQRFRVAVDLIGHAASDTEVSSELNNSKPLEIYYEWTGGGAHVALLTGRAPNGDYMVLDPWYGDGLRTRAAVLSGEGRGRWSDTYRTWGL